jgi:hypothetical protein
VGITIGGSDPPEHSGKPADVRDQGWSVRHGIDDDQRDSVLEERQPVWSREQADDCLGKLIDGREQSYLQRHGEQGGDPEAWQTIGHLTSKMSMGTSRVTTIARG